MPGRDFPKPTGMIGPARSCFVPIAPDTSARTGMCPTLRMYMCDCACVWRCCICSIACPSQNIIQLILYPASIDSWPASLVSRLCAAPVLPSSAGAHSQQLRVNCSGHSNMTKVIDLSESDLTWPTTGACAPCSVLSVLMVWWCLSIRTIGLQSMLS